MRTRCLGGWERGRREKEGANAILVGARVSSLFSHGPNPYWYGRAAHSSGGVGGWLDFIEVSVGG